MAQRSVIGESQMDEHLQAMAAESIATRCVAEETWQRHLR